MNELNNLHNFIKNTSELELEIKLGKFINTQFTADVNEIIYNKLISLLETNKENIDNKTFNRSISCHKGHHRIELFLNAENEIIGIEELNKKRIKNFDLPKSKMRITLSKETVIFKNNQSNISNLGKKIIDPPT